MGQMTDTVTIGPCSKGVGGVSCRQLSEALGVHYQTIGYLERGEYSPSLFLALRIAEYFEVPIEVVFSTEPFARIGSSRRHRLELPGFPAGQDEVAVTELVPDTLGRAHCDSFRPGDVARRPPPAGRGSTPACAIR